MTSYTGSDEVMSNLFSSLDTHTSTFSDLTQKLAAADGDMDKAVASFMETSDHPDAVKFRKAVELATQRLRELAAKSVTVTVLSDEDKTKAKEQMTLLKEKIRKTRDAIETVAPLRDDTENLLKCLSEVPDPTKSGRGRPKGSAGSTTPRPRVNLVLISSAAPDKPQKYDSFSKAAPILNTDVADLQTVYAQHAGVKPEDVSKVKKAVEFTYTPNGSETVWTVKITPKAA